MKVIELSDTLSIHKVIMDDVLDELLYGFQKLSTSEDLEVSEESKDSREKSKIDILRDNLISYSSQIYEIIDKKTITEDELLLISINTSLLRNIGLELATLAKK